MSEKKIVVSFSGGRTSAYMCKILKELYGDNLIVIFFNTSAEHPKTYKFIREVNEAFDLNLVCLEVDINYDGRNNYRIVDINDMQCDLSAFGPVTQKYGRPSYQSALCTREMKERLCKRYLKMVHGLSSSDVDEFDLWLGIRADEPKRVVGEALYRRLRKDEDMDDWDIIEAYRGATLPEYADEYLDRRIAERGPVKYLAEISDFDKQDVLDFWKTMPFDLEIPEHLGNCVFCVKKSVNKVALAMKDEPELAAQWQLMMDCANNREDLTNPKYRKYAGAGLIYREGNSVVSIRARADMYDRNELANRVRSMKQYDTGSCSESCEAFGSDD